MPRRLLQIAATTAIAMLIAGCGGAASPSPSSSSPSPEPTPTPIVTPALPAPEPPAEPSPQQDTGTYVVRNGDTLWSISRKFGITLEALQEANPEVTDPKKLRIGQKLVIPPR